MRHAAFLGLVEQAFFNYDVANFASEAKAYGVDVRKILAAADPDTTATTAGRKKAKRAASAA